MNRIWSRTRDTEKEIRNARIIRENVNSKNQTLLLKKWKCIMVSLFYAASFDPMIDVSVDSLSG